MTNTPKSFAEESSEAADKYFCKLKYSARVMNVKEISTSPNPGITEVDKHFQNGANWALESEVVRGMAEAATSLMNLEDDYQAEDTRGIHFAVQYWIEEKARRKSKLFEALKAYEQALAGGGK